jgi:MOSC domain-containing protein YiiM
MPGSIEAILVAVKSGQPMQNLASAALVAGSGIRGDRNYRDALRDGLVHDQQITLIAAEEIDRFNSVTGLGIGGADTRRNVVTRDVDLSVLVGREFRVGVTTLIGVELCEPCATLGKELATVEVSAAKVVQTFLHRAGLRARINVGGTIARGDRIDV